MRWLKDMKEEDVWDFKYRKCFLVYCQLIIFKVMKDLFDFHPESKNGTENVNAFYKTVSKSAQSRSVKRVVKDWPANFELNNDEPDMDKKLSILSCLCFVKFVIYTNSDNYELLPDSILKHTITLIEMRNELSHEGVLTVTESQKVLKNLLEYVQDICEIMTKSFDVHEKYKSLFDDFKRKFYELWNYEENQFITQGSKDVLKLYNNLFGSKIKKSAFDEVFNDCSERFVKPILLEVANNPKNHSSTSINYENIFENNNLAIIIGEAGSGKSTLCEKFVYSFRHSQRLTSDFDLVLLIDVKNVEKGASLFQYLKYVFFKETFKKGAILYEYLKKMFFREDLFVNEEDIFFYYLRQLKILFIIDDYDEKSMNSKELLDTIFKGFYNKHFLFTTKAHFADNLSERLKHHFPDQPLKLKLTGLKDIKDLHPYLKHCIVESWETYYDLLPTDLKENLNVPAITMLFLYMILHHKCIRNFNTLTLTFIYIQIHSEILLSNSDEPISPKMNELYKYCYDVFDKPESRKFYINSILDFNSAEQFSKIFFKPSLNLWSIEQDPFEHYEIIHESLIEFFASHYILSMVDEGKKLEEFFPTNILKHSGVFYHLVGILYHQKKLCNYFNSVIVILETNFKDEEISYKDDFNLLWKIVHQTMCTSPTPDINLCTAIGTRMLPRIMELNDESVESGISLITFIKNYIPETIKITLTNYVEKLSFENVMKRKELKNSKLHLKTNCYQNCESTYPISLSPDWVNLTTFEGIINSSDLDVLARFKCLEYLKVKLNYDVLDKLVKKLANMKTLKELHLIFKEPLSGSLLRVNRISLRETPKLIVELLETKNLSHTICTFKQLNIFTKKIDKAIIQLDANLSDENELNTVEKHFREFRDVIKDGGELKVKSRREIGSKQRFPLGIALGNVKLI